MKAHTEKSFELTAKSQFFTDSFSGCDGTTSGWGSCCQANKRCGVAEGDCDSDDDCAGNLLCGTDNCLSPFSSNGDCCYDPIPSKQIVIHSRLSNKRDGWNKRDSRKISQTLVQKYTHQLISNFSVVLEFTSCIYTINYTLQ